MGRPNGTRGVTLTAAQLRRLATALPDVVERDHLGSASFLVSGKIFAQLTADETAALVKLPLADQAAAVAAEPQRFTLPAHWSQFGWTYVALSGTSSGELRDLLEGSWLAIAPKRLAATWRAQPRA